jgi:hypothetical protein
MNIPPVPFGKERQWLKCKKCGNVVYYDYVPYSLSNPIMWLPCGHDDPTRKLHHSVNEITAKEALTFLLNKKEYGHLGRSHLDLRSGDANI